MELIMILLADAQVSVSSCDMSLVGRAALLHSGEHSLL